MTDRVYKILENSIIYYPIFRQDTIKIQIVKYLLGLAGGPQSALPPGKKITGSGGGGGGGSYLCFDSEATCSLERGSLNQWLQSPIKILSKHLQHVKS